MNRFFWLVIVSCHCWAQTGVTAIEQINARSLNDLRGDTVVYGCNPRTGQTQVGCSVDTYTTVPTQRPHEQSIGQTISVRQLSHKIPKEAAKDFQHAVKLSRVGDHENAAAELEAAVHRDPELLSAENRLGIEYAYLGRREEAEMAFRRTIDLEPDWWVGHYNLALILYSIGDVGNAKNSIRRAQALSSENPQLHLTLGTMLVMQEETRAEGIKELRLAAHTMPSAKQVLRDLGTR